MNPSQSKRIADILKSVQEIRRKLDKEAANGMTGIGVPFGTNLDMDDAVWGIVYVEKALARIWEREGYARELPATKRAEMRVKPTITRDGL